MWKYKLKRGDFLEYMGTSQASDKWGIPSSIIAGYCRKGKIKSAEQDKPGSPWRIDVNEPKPDYKPRKKL